MTDRLTLPIFEITGQNCLTLDQGDAVYNRIHPELLAGRSVALEFSGVEIFASPFFNAAVGRLLRDIPAEDLNRLLAFEHLSASGLEVLRHVVENSKEYYANSETRAALDRILTEQTSED